MSKSVWLSELSPLIQEALSAGGEARITVTGNSMAPLLRHRRDSVVLMPLQGAPRKYDIPLYRRKDGKFILHRIVKVRKHDYVLCGDNQTHKEYGVTDDMLIAVVKGIERDGVYLDCGDPAYRRYARRRCRTLPYRAARVRAKAILLRIRGMLFGKKS